MKKHRGNIHNTYYLWQIRIWVRTQQKAVELGGSWDFTWDQCAQITGRLGELTWPPGCGFMGLAMQDPQGTTVAFKFCFNSWSTAARSPGSSWFRRLAGRQLWFHACPWNSRNWTQLWGGQVIRAPLTSWGKGSQQGREQENLWSWNWSRSQVLWTGKTRWKRGERQEGQGLWLGQRG